eukprot:15347116-Ditylum_brightwellii.AAC.1
MAVQQNTVCFLARICQWANIDDTQALSIALLASELDDLSFKILVKATEKGGMTAKYKLKTIKADYQCA